MKQSISIPEMYMQFTETDLKKKKPRKVSNSSFVDH